MEGGGLWLLCVLADSLLSFSLSLSLSLFISLSFSLLCGALCCNRWPVEKTLKDQRRRQKKKPTQTGKKGGVWGVFRERERERRGGAVFATESRFCGVARGPRPLLRPGGRVFFCASWLCVVVGCCCPARPPAPPTSEVQLRFLFLFRSAPSLWGRHRRENKYKGYINIYIYKETKKNSVIKNMKALL